MRRAGFASLAGAVAVALTLGSGSVRSMDPVALAYCAETEVADITGTNGQDNLVGTPASEFIVGLGGDDVIDGGGGEDTICGGDGNDRLFGGGGGDELSGDRGDDYLDGGFEPEGRHDVVMYEGASGPVTAT